MDITEVAGSFAGQAASVQVSAAISVFKQSIDAERDAVLTILGAPNPQANLASGVGNSLDVSA